MGCSSNIGEGTASLRIAVLPSVVEYHDELDGVSNMILSADTSSQLSKNEM